MPDTDQSGRIIAAFPATGKTWFAQAHPYSVQDSDSSTFSRGSEWPGNYIAHIEWLVGDGMTVLVSTHAEVRQALADAGLFFTLVYPQRGLRDEYRKRMERRGSPSTLVGAVYGMWDTWIDGCRDQRGCDHIILQSGEYLSDVIAEVRCAA